MKLRVVLVIAIILLGANATRMALRPRASSGPDNGASSPPLPSRTSSATMSVKSASAVAKWSELHADDLATFTHNLRHAGFSERLVRALVAAEIDERFRPREAALAPSRKPAYWQLELAPQPLATRLARLDLRREKARLRQQLLGPDPAEVDNDTPVAPEKRELVRMITEDYGALLDDARTRSGTGALASERKEIELLETERKRELGAVLSPDEMRAYELILSGAIRPLKKLMQYFEPTDDEFAAFVAHGSRNVPEEIRSLPPLERREAEKEFLGRQDAALKAAIGDQRYAEFQRSKDEDYRVLHDVTRRAGLESTALEQALEIRNATLAEAFRLAGDTQLSAEAKSAARTLLAQNARTQFRDTLGSQAGEAFVRFIDQGWLQQVEQGSMRRLSPSAR